MGPTILRGRDISQAVCGHCGKILNIGPDVEAGTCVCGHPYVVDFPPIGNRDEITVMAELPITLYQQKVLGILGHISEQLDKTCENLDRLERLIVDYIKERDIRQRVSKFMGK